MIATPTRVSITVAYGANEGIRTDCILLSDYENLERRVNSLVDDLQNSEEILRFYSSKICWDNGSVQADHGDKARDFISMTNCPF